MTAVCSIRLVRLRFLLTGIAVLLIGACIVLLPVIGVLGVRSFAARLQIHPPSWLVFTVVVIAMLIWRYGVAIYGLRWIFEGRRLIVDATRSRRADRFVLYLRSFEVDGQSSNPLYNPPPLTRLSPQQRTGPGIDPNVELFREIQSAIYGRENTKSITSLFGNTYEQQIRFATARVGLLTSIWNPYETTEGLEAARLTVPRREDWRSMVMELIHKADLVIVRGGATDGLLWELKQLRSTVDPTRLLLFFPRDAFDAPEDCYATIKVRIEAAIGVALPSTSLAPYLVGFAYDWSAHPIYDRTSTSMKVLLYGASSSTANVLKQALKARNLPCRRVPPIGLTVLGLLRWFALIGILFGLGSCMRMCVSMITT